MTIEEQLKQEILSRYKSIREFAAMTTIPYSTIDSVLKRGIKNSGVGTVIKIFSFLDIDVESIASGELKLIDANKNVKKQPPAQGGEPLYPPEYDLLSPANKAIVDRLIADLAKNQSPD